MSQCTYSVEYINEVWNIVIRIYLVLGDEFLCRLCIALELLDPVDDDCLVDPAGALGGHIVCETLAPGRTCINVHLYIRKHLELTKKPKLVIVPLIVGNCIFLHILAKSGVICMAILIYQGVKRIYLKTHHTLSYPSRSEILQAFSMATSHSFRIL